MSQRGGAVQAHLRLSDQAIYSDLIPHGSADMILAIEPLEALRYLDFLSDTGIVLANTSPLVSMPDYGDTELILDRVAQRPRHRLIEANRLAASAGSSRAVNMVMFGAAACVLELSPQECRDAIGDMLAARGRDLVEANCRAYELGRQAAFLYGDGLAEGLTPRAVRERLARMTPAEMECISTWRERGEDEPLSLSDDAVRRIDELLFRISGNGRTQLLEPEVYAIVQAAGAISPPRHVLVSDPAQINEEILARFAGDRIVLKAVSPQIVHKSDANAIACIPNQLDVVRRHTALLMVRAREIAERVDGVLLIEYVEHESAGFGGELFVGVRATREFGPVLAAGLGGIDTEYLAAKLRPGLAVAKVPALELTTDEFFSQFQRTAAYEILSGAARGHPRMVSNGELRRCFRAFMAIARRYCIPRADNGPELIEIEVNPFAFRRQSLVPLDGRGRLGKNPAPPRPRSPDCVDRLLAPRSIAIAGVSSSRQNFGRIILNNTLRCGFPAEALTVIKPKETGIDGVRCVPSLAELPKPVDLLILATGVNDISASVEHILTTAMAKAVIIITGGLGERTGTEQLHEALRQQIERRRRVGNEGPVFLGENCMGVRSRMGRYDTFFIQDKKLDPRRLAPPRPLALVSQSGAFVIARLSNAPELDPVLAVSIGNQLDVSLSDVVAAAGRRTEVDVIGVYAEGFREGDGLELVRTIRSLTASGKQIVFYKAGRTESGRLATAGHTASVAGDYNVCLSAVEQAGGLVVETVTEFETMLQMAVAYHRLPVRGTRIAALTNAGCEAVVMADSIIGPRHSISLPPWTALTERKLREIIATFRLDTLVNIANPLDVTPMAGDAVFEAIISTLLDDPGNDAVVISIVPLTPEMHTSPDELDHEDSLARRLPALAENCSKPLVVVVDAGGVFDPLVCKLRTAGLVVLRASDQAVQCLGRYCCHRIGTSGRSRASSPAASQYATSAGAHSRLETPAGLHIAAWSHGPA